MSNLDPANAARQSRMSLLAKSEPSRLAALFSEVTDVPAHTWLRTPEIGAVMVRGRMGGTGAPFNLGEMSVTRCALTLSTGEVGHAYVQGRDKDHATRAALVDALMQTARAEEVQAAVLDPLGAEALATKAARSAKSAATKVEFFTMVRGED
ncbi:phosphonate C-P lyase system protein PhnG [Donghicola tyrosinivorans]|uniref:Alpha-D-ribose 1-methylphosphonate 5-triphosphate synthase subunit PhnG n=1 Tax=Donghicola tyrosinivorans TaxID=1652492 RepID=A0A2T0WRN2_9RHOB|nr:phosphonate C-P lyase system protein PhnG [Donghicola tyrosinivorans]PRY89356.1 alpha-D-ribose 1-methylphosphonate 5-triphosphate synthase subunit PhnG [Donghicola tyrosinivorans]